MSQSDGVDKPLSIGMQKLSPGDTLFQGRRYYFIPPVKLFRTILTPRILSLRVKVIPRILLRRILYFATPAIGNRQTNR